MKSFIFSKKENSKDSIYESLIQEIQEEAKLMMTGGGESCLMLPCHPVHNPCPAPCVCTGTNGITFTGPNSVPDEEFWCELRW